MSRKNIINLLLILLGIVLVTPLVTTESNYFTLQDSDCIALSSVHNPIVIRSPHDFEEQGFSGNGSENNPYLIKDLHIEFSQAYSACIEIIGIFANIEICNCTLNYDSLNSWDRQDGIGISLSFVYNCAIINCTFTNLESGIDAPSCNNTSFVKNTFKHCRIGLRMDYGGNSTVKGNMMFFNGIGIVLYGVSKCNITANLIAYNTEIGVYLDYPSHQNNIFNNTIAYNQEDLTQDENNAQDDGYDNLWDDNLTIGNSWSDYSGEGVYNITGSANSVDRFPTLALFDLAGPEIYWLTDWRVTVYAGPCPFSDLTIHASVRDQSGVDSVLIYYSGSLNGTWTCTEMIYAPTDQYPDLFL